MKTLFILVSTLVSLNAFAFELSDLNGTWVENIDGIKIQFTISGLPDGRFALNQPVTVPVVGYTLGVRVDEVCQIAKLEDNKFESRCSTARHTDHTYIQFTDNDTFVETDLNHGFGKNVAVRQ